VINERQYWSNIIATNRVPIPQVVVVVVFRIAVESKRYADTSVATVSQWEDHIALGVKIDEGNRTGPILLLLAVATN